MIIDPASQDLYRMNFRDYLRKKDDALPRVNSKVVVADVYLHKRPELAGLMPRNATDIIPPSHKVDTYEKDPSLFINELKEITGKKVSDHTYRYVMYDTTFASWTTRKIMEDIVRRVKRSRSPCPHCSESNTCLKPAIRCGERMQYSTRENQDEQNLPHTCNYAVLSKSSKIIIVDHEKAVQDFIKNTIHLFLGIDYTDILVTSSASRAVDMLNNCKVENTRCSLVICDIGMHGMTGFDLANEIFSRNYDTNIILTKPKGFVPIKPKEYLGDVEIIPGEPLVRAVLEKPFHSDEFLKIVAALRNKRLL